MDVSVLEGASFIVSLVAKGGSLGLVSRIPRFGGGVGWCRSGGTTGGTGTSLLGTWCTDVLMPEEPFCELLAAMTDRFVRHLETSSSFSCLEVQSLGGGGGLCLEEAGG